MNQNSFNVYKDNEKLISSEKKIFIISFIISVILVTTFAILAFFFRFLYSLPLSYIIGFIAGDILFYYTIRSIRESNNRKLKKQVNKIHLISMITYLVLFIIDGILFLTWYGILSLALGLLTIKVSIYLAQIIKKRK